MSPRPAVLTLALFGLACAPPEEPPPSLYDDAALRAELESSDGFEGVSPRLSGFVHGAPVQYWRVAQVAAGSMPAYQLCVEDGERCVATEHPVIIDHLPGEAGYSPFFQLHPVAVPAGFARQITSVAEVVALADEMGVAPIRGGSELLHCPVAGLDARLEVSGAASAEPERRVYVRDVEARCFDFSSSRPNRSVFPSGELFVRNVYMLTREGDSGPLVEEAQGVDWTGDGDQLDSNNIFGVGLEDADYTPLWRLVTVTIGEDVRSLPETGDQTDADYRDSDDIFDTAPDYTITPLPGRVLDHELTETLINCPLQSAEGML